MSKKNRHLEVHLQWIFIIFANIKVNAYVNR